MKTFLYSNFGVIKCYNLVFSLAGKLTNIGFWFFGVMIISHIPLYIMYCINRTTKMVSFINKEMEEKGYNNTIPTFHNQKKTNNLTKDFNIKKHLTNPRKILLIKRIDNAEDIINNLNLQNLDTIETNLQSIVYDGRKEGNKKNKIMSSFKKNIPSSDLHSEGNKKKRKYKRRSNKNLNLIMLPIQKSEENKLNIEEQMNKEYIKKYNNNFNVNDNDKVLNNYKLILINANNSKDHNPFKSNYVINNYDYDEAIIYEKRSFCRIFFILLIAKENILNMIFFNPPLVLKPIRISLFIFNYACDYALNALFYLSDNISDKYHYTGLYAELYTLVNNFLISFVSTVVSFILLTFFDILSQSTSKIEKLFREEEVLLKNDIKYKVPDEKKSEIRNKIKDIIKCLRIKIIFFIILESIFMLFFFYYATAFCQVYKSTQVSWILDCISSYVISLGITLVLSFIFSIFYKLSIKYQLKLLYKIIRILY